MKNVGYILILFAVFSCTDIQSDANNIVEQEVSDHHTKLMDNPTEMDEDTIAEGNRKSMLIGDWQDRDDAELTISISPNKYTTYINGKKNWDNPWNLCNYTDYAPENEDDNGKYVLVRLADKSAVFYSQEILSITENQLEVKIIKSNAGSGMTQTFIRI